jgi:hypothetical protein
MVNAPSVSSSGSSAFPADQCLQNTLPPVAQNLQALQRDHPVEAAGAEAFEVQSDEFEAQAAESGDELTADLRLG